MLKVGNNLKVSYITVLLIAAGLYAATCAPGALWQDSGMYQYRIRHNDIEGKLGLALSHPLYHIIGIGVKHIPLGEFAYRVNLISAVAAAFTIANLFLLLRIWLKRNLPAVIAAATLALSHTFWRHAVIAETYTLYTALLLAELLMLLQYVKTKRKVYLYLLGLFNGLAIANHMFAVIALTGLLSGIFNCFIGAKANQIRALWNYCSAVAYRCSTIRIPYRQKYHSNRQFYSCRGLSAFWQKLGGKCS